MSLKEKIWGRIKEPSSMAGAALILAGVDKMFDVNEVGQAAEVLNQAAQQPTWLGAAMAALGAFAIWFREKGAK